MPTLERNTPRLQPWGACLRALVWASASALAVVLAGALVLATTGGHPFFQGIDDAWHVALSASRTSWLNGANRVLDFVGNTGMYIYGVALFLALLVRHRRLALFTAGANLGTAGATQLLKVLVGRDRPLDRLVAADTAAYPSGHVSATVAAVVATSIVVGRLWMWVSGAIIGVAMMYSRMYLGVHWLSDTVAGALLGFGLTLLLWAVVRDKCLQGHVRQRLAPP